MQTKKQLWPYWFSNCFCSADVTVIDAAESVIAVAIAAAFAVTESTVTSMPLLLLLLLLLLLDRQSLCWSMLMTTVLVLPQENLVAPQSFVGIYAIRVTRCCMFGIVAAVLLLLPPPLLPWSVLRQQSAATSRKAACTSRRRELGVVASKPGNASLVMVFHGHFGRGGGWLWLLVGSVSSAGRACACVCGAADISAM